MQLATSISKSLSDRFNKFDFSVRSHNANCIKARLSMFLKPGNQLQVKEDVTGVDLELILIKTTG